MSTDQPGSAARCVPLCAAGDKAPWWQHEALCPARVRGTAPMTDDDQPVATAAQHVST